MSLHSSLLKFRSALATGRGQRRRRTWGSARAARHWPSFEVLEDRCVPAQYAVTDLGTFGGDSFATDLNEAGQVAGYSYSSTAVGNRAFVWNNGTMIDLGPGRANAINDLGQIVGHDGSGHAFLVTPQGGVWFQDSDLDGRNDFMIDLGTLDDGSSSSATDINNAGQVVGYSGSLAFLWEAGNGMTDLGSFTPVGINEAGQVAGNAAGAVLWDAAHGMIALGAGPGYTDSYAVGLNDSGQIVGYQWGPDDYYLVHAFVWTPGTPNGSTGVFTDLGLPIIGYAVHDAGAINNAGQVVGTYVDYNADYNEFSEEVPYIWDAAGGTTYLQFQTSLPAWKVDLDYARANNDGGSIAVNGASNAAHHAYLLTPVPPGTPTISIADAPSVTEGNSGARAASFTVTLSAPSTQTVTVAYATGNGAATAGSDFQAASGTLTFAPGEMSKTITVPVNGDRLPEPTETFVVNLSNPTNVVIADGHAVGTVADDEPRISISDLIRYEGRMNKKTLFTFTVSLSVPYDAPVTVSYRTANGTATTSDGDYVAKTGTLTFAPGETTKTITIEVKGDSKREANETFYLDLFGLSSNALFTKNRGVGTILNDD